MEKTKTAEGYYAKDAPFKKEIALLREIAHRTEAIETCKWGMPVYTITNKNVFGICRFKSHFGVWFFNGAFLSDPKNVLANAQEGKTKAMRHWKFYAADQIQEKEVLQYMNEAIENQKKGIRLVPKKQKKEVQIPIPLRSALEQDQSLKKAFGHFTPYKQKEFCEYIEEAKQEKTKLRRLDKILPMIQEGVGLNDAYR
ncbi:MAG: DUF1801 domain-containing protein [Bacteroidota bacterium]